MRDLFIVRNALFVIIILALSSCNYFSKEAEERINEGLKYVNAQLEKDYRNACDTFNLAYQKAIISSEDSTRRNKILFFRSDLFSTVTYIDSLKEKIKPLNRDDSESIKRMFLTEKIADSLFDKVEVTHTLAEQLALTADQKSAIKKERENLSDWDKTKDQVFTLNTPEGTSWFLYALETELLRTSSLILKVNK